MSETSLSTASKAYEQRWEKLLAENESYYVPEKYQLGIVTDFLESHDIAYTTEGEVFCYPLDVVAVKRETTIAIELKSRNVGKGIEQALRNSDFVDYSYLSVWEEKVTEDLVNRVDELDIGLIGVDQGVRVYSGPVQTPQQLCKREDIFELVDPDVRSDPPLQQ